MPESSSSNTTGGQSPSTSGQQTSGLNRGISIIRELISSVESVGGSYDSIFGGSTSTPLTTMTIAQVLRHQQQMINKGAKSTAAGKYQFIMGSLREYAGKLNMDINSTIFNTATQDALADVLIKEKGYDLYKSGKITSEQFLDRLSRAWAGLPSPSKGGQSFYSGDGLNKSHISIQKALDQIGQARTGGIFSGPSTGYLAMLHGDEAVIPANPGSSALEFSTSMGNDEAELVNVFSMITNKVDRMISLNRDIISTQRKFAVYGLN
jgi:muramidase (phage lysozyme)